MLPETIGPYRIVREIATGGMGSVFEAFDWENRTHVAVKTVKAAYPNLRAGIHREIRALARLSHPSIVSIIAEGTDDREPWFAMEYLDGVDLTHHLEVFFSGEAPSTGKRPAAAGKLPETLRLVRLLCDPLLVLHQEGLVHGDLKPANVIVRADGTPILVDFGITSAYRVGRELLADPMGLVGTLEYVAPERIRGEVVDARSDLYSLGCLLYELLTGRPPFVATDAGDLLKLHLSDAPVPASEFVTGVPGNLERLLSSLLAKDRGRRPGYADIVAIRLEEILNGIGETKAPHPPAPTIVPYLYRPAFRGRQGLRKRCLAEINRALEGMANLIFVEGQGGSGRTRFVTEVARNLDLPDVRVVICPSDATEPPLAPFRKLVAGLLESRLDKQPKNPISALTGSVLRNHLPELRLAAGFESWPEAPPIAGSAGTLRIFCKLADLLRTLSAASPCVMVLDDVDRRDELTRGFIAYLERSNELRDERIAIVAVASTDPTDDRLDASRHRIVHRLEPLPLVEVQAISRDMLATQELPPGLAEDLNAPRFGNPLLLVEYLKAAVADGRLIRSFGAAFEFRRLPAGQAGDTAPAAATLVDLTDSRIARLDAAALACVRACSVLEPEISAGGVAEILAIPHDEAVDAIALLVRGGFLVAKDDGSLGFAGAHLRSAVYGAMSATEKKTLHRAAARRLAARDRDEQELDQLAMLADHYESAGETREAAAAHLAAARVALKSHALAAADRHYRCYLDLGPEETEEHVRAGLELAGDVLRTSARNQEALSTIAAAVEEARRLHQPTLLAECLNVLAVAEMQTGNMQDAERTLTAARSLARERGDRKHEGVLLGNLANLRFQQGRMDEAASLYRESMAIDREEEDRAGEAISLGNLAMVFHATGRLDQAATLYTKAREVAKEAGDLAHEAHLVGSLAVLHQSQGRPDEAMDRFVEAQTLAHQAGDRGNEGFIIGMMAAFQLQRARYREATALAEQAIETARDSGDPRYESFALATLGDIQRDQRRFGDAASCYAKALSLASELSNRRLEGQMEYKLGGIEPEPDKRRERIDRGIQILREVGDSSALGMAIAQAGEQDRLAGDAERAEARFLEAIALLQGVGESHRMARVEILLARLYLATGDMAKAEARAVAARRIFARLDDPRHEAEALSLIAAVRLAGGDESSIPLLRRKAKHRLGRIEDVRLRGDLALLFGIA